MTSSFRPFCSDTTQPSGARRSVKERTASSVSGAFTESSTDSSEFGSASGVVASTGTVKVSAKPRIVRPRCCIARTCSTSLSTNSTDSPPRTMCAPTVPPIAPAPKTVYRTAQHYHGGMPRSVVVTGAADGIGRGIATRFAEMGCAVGLLDYSADKLQQTAARLADQGHKVLSECVDVRDAGA